MDQNDNENPFFFVSPNACKRLITVVDFPTPPFNYCQNFRISILKLPLKGLCSSFILRLTKFMLINTECFTKHSTISLFLQQTDLILAIPAGSLISFLQLAKKNSRDCCRLQFVSRTLHPKILLPERRPEVYLINVTFITMRVPGALPSTQEYLGLRVTAPEVTKSNFCL